MKNRLKYFAHIVSAMLVSGGFLFALVPVANAQSFGHFVFVNQSNNTIESQFVPDVNGNTLSWSIHIGTGWIGTTTGAFVTATSTTSGWLADNDFIHLDINGTGPHGSSQCQYRTTGNQTILQPIFNQLVMWSQSNSGCTFLSNQDYTILISVSGHGGAHASGNIYGSSVNNTGWTVTQSGTLAPDPNVAIPQFAIVGNGFQITPTTTDSGLFLSGANDFCASAFASSSAPAIINDVGVAGCDVLGFAFVPSPSSLQQYTGIQTYLAGVIPFSYYYDIAGIFSGSSASTSQNMVAYSANLSQFDFASSTGLGPILPTAPFSFFSSSTISHYLPVGMHDFLYNLMIGAIWVEVLFLLYRKIVPNKAKI